MLFCGLLIFFNINSFGNTMRVSNSLDPDQARHFVGPDLCPNCLQRLSADDTNGQKVNSQSATKNFQQMTFSSFIGTFKKK